MFERERVNERERERDRERGRDRERQRDRDRDRDTETETERQEMNGLTLGICIQNDNSTEDFSTPFVSKLIMDLKKTMEPKPGSRVVFDYQVLWTFSP